MQSMQKTDLTIMTPRHFVDRYCNQLGMNEELILLVKFIAYKIQDNQIIAENTPQSSEAGIVYFVAYACGLNI
jgi:transcription initiation factor TFIIIB Brf1 subunit/transcription initiation factor TFIIB